MLYEYSLVHHIHCRICFCKTIIWDCFYGFRPCADVFCVWPRAFRVKLWWWEVQLSKLVLKFQLSDGFVGQNHFPVSYWSPLSVIACLCNGENTHCPTSIIRWPAGFRIWSGMEWFSNNLAHSWLNLLLLVPAVSCLRLWGCGIGNCRQRLTGLN